MGEFLPVSRQEMRDRGWDGYDFLVVTADAYVDHPSFGTTIIARVLEAEGYRVAILSQPDWHSAAAFQRMGRPRWGAFIGGGNIDSMVAHYTAAKKRRSRDQYSPGGKMGLRPDRPTIVYANRCREAFPGLPVVIGGLEASLRRFAHYDYWDDKVRRSILFDAQADLMVYGMGERATREIAGRLAAGTPVEEITDVRGTAYAADSPAPCPFSKTTCASYEEVCADKRSYAQATKVEYDEHDPVRGRAILQRHGAKWLIVNPPSAPLSTKELDAVAELPYVREVHPMYDQDGGVPAIEEVRFSVTHNRGCFGGCNFCSLAFHQGRMITSRSHESCIREVTEMTHDPKFKGYIHDVGGPSANFRHPSCQEQLKRGMCKNRSCLAPTPCRNIDPDHSDYTKLLQELRAIPGVKKVFVRSGIRYDYLLAGRNDEFFRELVNHHISGQLKVAPEHCVAHVLDYMGKPHFDVFESFWDKYQTFNRKEGREQYLVPYLMSSHPGCTLSDAVELAEFLHSTGHQPEQVQDFYPTPGTLSTCMYYTGIDPRTMQPVYVATDPHDKALQRALLQWRKPEMRRLVVEALHKAGREDLIGYGPQCLIRPLHGGRSPAAEAGGGQRRDKGRRGASTPRQGEASPRQADTGRSGPNRGISDPRKRQGKPGTTDPRRGEAKDMPRGGIKAASSAQQPQKPLKRKKGWAKPKKRK
ncbi:YgiQ family radical SAM protein [Oscillibacter hominis]|uniref:YgiQ family radical SAM protein n=1 Tax=Oscillibacter hominis TaxID=2763056 RepID=A0A7G9B4R2_9FIRM|nr:YgiQ family radical SAM protein [Oscillibacter hominis]QNL44543.1 YgiQ family radical SAM protein [Oscillibacter hominis]